MKRILNYETNKFPTKIRPKVSNPTNEPNMKLRLKSKFKKNHEKMYSLFCIKNTPQL